MRSWAIALALLVACSRPPETGRVVVALTVDWEGAELNPDGLDAIDWLRKRVPGPFTHFVSAAYFTKAEPEPVVATLTEMVKPGDELAVHLHLWRSLAKASGVEPRISPSFMTGTAEVEDYDGDAGYETDPDVYDVAELRALLVTSRTLLAQSKLPISRSFRAGGFLATPKVLAALRSEGFTADSSAFDHREIDLDDDAYEQRVAGVWPRVEHATQPFSLDDGMVELPIAAFADYTSADAVAARIDAAYARLAADPSRDQFLVFAFNLETAQTLAGRIGQGVEKARAAHEDLVFATVKHAAELARHALGSPPT
ncbi:MAG: hypothetical protein M4D80_07425 [Myxococcota bacterium]|nr:hypothetical protein [Myxococcota bacterium]